MTATFVVTGWSWLWLILGIVVAQAFWDGVEKLWKRRRTCRYCGARVLAWWLPHRPRRE